MFSTHATCLPTPVADITNHTFPLSTDTSSELFSMFSGGVGSHYRPIIAGSTREYLLSLIQRNLSFHRRRNAHKMIAQQISSRGKVTVRSAPPLSAQCSFHRPMCNLPEYTIQTTHQMLVSKFKISQWLLNFILPKSCSNKETLVQYIYYLIWSPCFTQQV